ncbi:hypothetical protein JZY06_04000, partial [Corynebacterium sp. CCM 8862]|nr:hypothetical protein [Corynebacterium mendelii]
MPILGAGTAATALLVAAALYVADLSPAGRLAPATGHPAGRAAGPTAAGTAAELDIFAAVIRAGLNPAAACAAVADSSGHPRDGPWATAAVLAGMGVDPARAYAPLAANPRLEQL